MVISIIALLVGILLPTLGKARRASYNAKCQSNLHQIGVAMIAYATDHDDLLPDRLVSGGWNYRIEPGTLMGDHYGPSFTGIGGEEQLGMAALLDDLDYMEASGGGWVCLATRPEYQLNGNTYSFSARDPTKKERLFIYGIDNGIETFIAWDSYNLEIGFPNMLGQRLPGTNLNGVGGEFLVHTDTVEKEEDSVYAVFTDGHVGFKTERD